MDDFLYNLRAGNHKSYDRHKRPYDTTRHKGSDRYQYKDKRKGYQHFTFNSEHFSALKKLMEESVDLQKRMTGAQDRIATAEERKAKALETIAARMGRSIPETIAPTVPEGISISKPSESTANSVGEEVTEETMGIDRLQIIRMIQAMRKNGDSYDKIAQHLQSKEIPTLSGKGIWRGQSVYRLSREKI